MKKRAAVMLSMEFFIQLVLVIVFLLFGIMLILRIYGSNVNSVTKDTVCWQSVLYNNERRLPGVNVETVKVKCPTKYVNFGIDSYTEEFEETDEGFIKFNPFAPQEEKVQTAYKGDDGKECKDIGDDEKREDCMFYNINKKIASEIKRCWTNFHEGKLRVFSTYTTDKQCVVCSNIIFDSEVVDHYSELGLMGLYKPNDANYDLDFYMRSRKIDPLNVSYYDYALDILDKNWEQPVYDYETGKDYAVVFTALNEHFIKTVGEQVWNDIKAKITNQAYPDEPNYINTLNFIPNDEVAVYCDTWA